MGRVDELGVLVLGGLTIGALRPFGERAGPCHRGAQGEPAGRETEHEPAPAPRPQALAALALERDAEPAAQPGQRHERHEARDGRDAEEHPVGGLGPAIVAEDEQPAHAGEESRRLQGRDQPDQQSPAEPGQRPDRPCPYRSDSRQAPSFDSIPGTPGASRGMYAVVAFRETRGRRGRERAAGAKWRARLGPFVGRLVAGPVLARPVRVRRARGGCDRTEFIDSGGTVQRLEAILPRRPGRPRVRRRCWRWCSAHPPAAATRTAPSPNSCPNQPPAVTISSPAANASIDEFQTVTFTGSATDPEDGALTGSALVWTSSIDGALGTGTSFTRDDLSPGDHVITLTATDGEGRAGTRPATSP